MVGNCIHDGNHTHQNLYEVQAVRNHQQEIDGACNPFLRFHSLSFAILVKLNGKVPNARNDIIRVVIHHLWTVGFMRCQVFPKVFFCFCLPDIRSLHQPA